MLGLILAVGLFAAVHLTTAVPQFKSQFKARYGAKSFGPAFGIASLLSLILIIFAWRNAEFVVAYEPPAWGRIANHILTLIGFLFLGIFLCRGSFRRVVKYPMGLAVLFWAAGHLLANGDQASVILFGGMAIYSILHVVLLARNGGPPAADVRQGHNLLSLLSGLALYGLMAQLHGVLIGVAVFQLTK